MFATILLLIASSLISVEAQTVSPWDVSAVWPMVGQGSYYGIGIGNAFQWTNNDTNALTAPITTLSLVLGTGSANQVTELYELASLPFPATTCFEWTPTANLTTNNNYTIVWKGMDKNKILVSVNYCTWFNLAARGDPTFPAATSCDGLPPVVNPAITTVNPTTTKTVDTFVPPPVIVPATSVTVQTFSPAPPLPLPKNDNVGGSGVSTSILALIALFFF
ncbi:hypothetical protein BDR26DRAFT_1014313 [Obelidium mucronatum]|nr:hypothetical protein BDR26DRAFT_1014313 [Obelidium mucronatum]